MSTANHSHQQQHSHSLAAVAAPASSYRSSGSWLPRVLAVLFIAGGVAAVLALAACADQPMSSSTGSAAKDGMKAPMPSPSASAPTK